MKTQKRKSLSAECLCTEIANYSVSVFHALIAIEVACSVTHCVLSVSSRYESCESLVCRSASCLLTDESISRTTSSSWPRGQCRDTVRSLIWFSVATSSARFSISFSIRRKFSSLAERASVSSNSALYNVRLYTYGSDYNYFNTVKKQWFLNITYTTLKMTFSCCNH